MVGAAVLVSGCGNGATNTYDPLLEMAEQGNALAQCTFANCNATGDGYRQDYEKALHWFAKAAEQGHSDAQRGLGVVYRDGLGTAQDYKIAASWFMKAAEQGHSDAQYSLACQYADGEGVPEDHEKAFHWFSKAAEQGDARGQRRIGLYYLYGWGAVTQSTSKAYTWGRIARLGGQDGMEIQILGSLASSLPAEQRTKAEAEANRLFEEMRKRKAIQQDRQQTELKALIKELGRRARQAESEGRELYRGN